MNGRRSYSGLMAMPVWLLYLGETLVASIRAPTADDARIAFKAAGLSGTHMRRG